MARKIIVAAVLALAGCSKHNADAPGDSAAGPAAAQATAGGLPHPLPGLYRSTVTLLGIDAPGMPPATVERMRAAMDRKAQGSTHCLTAEEAANGYEARVKQLAGRPQCAFDRYSAAAGKLDAQLTCGGAPGMKAVLTMHGTMSPTVSDVQMIMAQSGPQMPGGGMIMTMQVKSERLGDCP